MKKEQKFCTERITDLKTKTIVIQSLLNEIHVMGLQLNKEYNASFDTAILECFEANNRLMHGLKHLKKSIK